MFDKDYIKNVIDKNKDKIKDSILDKIKYLIKIRNYISNLSSLQLFWGMTILLFVTAARISITMDMNMVQIQQVYYDDYLNNTKNITKTNNLWNSIVDENGISQIQQKKPIWNPVTWYFYSGPFLWYSSTFQFHKKHEWNTSPQAIDYLPVNCTSYEKATWKKCNDDDLAWKNAIRSIQSWKILYAGGAFSELNYFCRNILGSSQGWFWNLVVVWNEDGWITVYSHLETINQNLYIWKRIWYWTLLWYMGNTGCSSTKHLHFEIRKWPVTPDLSFLYWQWPGGLKSAGYPVVSVEEYYSIIWRDDSLKNLWNVAYTTRIQVSLDDTSWQVDENDKSNMINSWFKFLTEINLDSIIFWANEQCWITNYYIPVIEAPLSPKQIQDINIQWTWIVKEKDWTYSVYKYNPAWRTKFPIKRRSFSSYQELFDWYKITGRWWELDIWNLACPKEFKFWDLVTIEFKNDLKQVFQCKDRGSAIVKWTLVWTNKFVYTFDIYSGLWQETLNAMYDKYQPLWPSWLVRTPVGVKHKTLTNCYYQK